jgi:hypothetical protein
MTGRGALRAPRQHDRPEAAPFVERRGSRLAAGPAPVAPVVPTGTDAPAYGDWTKPSGTSAPVASPAASDVPGGSLRGASAGGLASTAPPRRDASLPPLPPVAPPTSAIPDRVLQGRRHTDGDVDTDHDDRYDDGGHDDSGYDDDRDGHDRVRHDRYDDDRYDELDRYDDRYDDRHDVDVDVAREDDLDDLRTGSHPEVDGDLDRDHVDHRGERARRRGDLATGPHTGSHAALDASGHSSAGGRAARRAEREAAETARRQAAKRSGRPAAVALLDEEQERAARRPRVLRSLAAVGAVAAVLLGVYQFAAPDTQEAASQRSAPTTSAAPSSSAPVTAELPPLEVDPPPAVEPAPADPVRVPVTVLNATEITGLAANVSGELVDGGWPEGAVGGYPGEDVAASTVYFTEGSEEQRQSALQLTEKFPQLEGPAPLFFDIPAEVGAPEGGIVVVVTGDWQP